MSKRERLKAEVRKESRKTGDVRASLQDLPMSARKVRVVADLVRGKNIEDALTQLAFQRRAAAKPLQKLLDSAVANASERGLDVDRLVINEIEVHKGPIRRRFMPRAHGRATRIRKQSAHIDVKLAPAS